MHSDLLQRAYYSGRYAYLCCSGASTSRLYGMWTGEWNAGWGSKYTMDANVNLQTSSLNTSNMPYSVTGYVYFLLRQMPDWEENALATHGFTDALQAPVNTDGDKAVITETCYPYPFRYWNAGTSWMLLPLYESYLSYGDMEIPLSEEFDLEALRSVLSVTADDLTDAQIAAIRERGSLTLSKDILLPLLTKAANYWAQLLTPEYYTDKDGNIVMKRAKQHSRTAKPTAFCRATPPKKIRRITRVRLPQIQRLTLRHAEATLKCFWIYRKKPHPKLMPLCGNRFCKSFRRICTTKQAH